MEREMSAPTAPPTTAVAGFNTPLWHPFSALGTLAEEVVIDRGEGIWVWDEEGRQYLDGSAGLWYTNVGHGREEIRRAISEQLGRLETHHVFGDYANRPALDLAARLSELAPSPDSKVFLLSGGGDAIDTAAKLARLYWDANGQPERRTIISRLGGYHGTHGFGTSVAGIAGNKVGYGPLITDVATVPHDSLDALQVEIERLGPDRVAAVLFEPVIASGGLLTPPAGYLEGLAELCESYGILTIADSVVSGFGRLGTWFGVERWGLQPDLIVFAKGVTSGYLPLGGVIASERVAHPFTRPGSDFSFRHGPTYSGHATCCAAALANLAILEDEALLERSRALEGVLFAALAELAENPIVATVRGGVGLLGAVILRDDLVAANPSIANDALVAARAAGVLTRPLDDGLAVSPPLTITEEEIGLLATRLALGFEALAAQVDAATDRLPSPMELAGEIDD